LIIAALLFSVTACDVKPSERKPKHNVIKEYVNTPRDKAKDVKNRLESTQNKVNEQSKELDEE
jgi:hypothetical protein